MKALELTWYDRDDQGDYIHPARYVISSIDVDYWVECKRLSDAELAAEFHSMDCDRLALRADGYESRLELDRALTLLKFATLPHYDEADQ